MTVWSEIFPLLIYFFALFVEKLYLTKLFKELAISLVTGAF